MQEDVNLVQSKLRQLKFKDRWLEYFIFSFNILGILLSPLHLLDFGKRKNHLFFVKTLKGHQSN